MLRFDSGEPLKLRIEIIDGSIVDIFYSVTGKYSYHWERSLIDGSIYRHDNAPHQRWQSIKTFPKHVHHGSEDAGEESYLSDDPHSVSAGATSVLAWIYNQILSAAATSQNLIPCGCRHSTRCQVSA